MSTTFGRLRAIATAALASAITLVAAPLAQAADVTPAPTDAVASSRASHFLVTQLAANGHFLNTPPSDFGVFPDTGNTIDAILALAAAQEGGTEAGLATTWVESQIGSYTGGGTELYAGSLGKATVLALAQGRDPHSFGGQDLVTQLISLQGADGHFSDQSAYGDYSNMIGQSWDVIAMHRVGADAQAAPGAAFIVSEQCADGGFPTYFAKDPCVGNTDATAFALQALIAVRGATDPAVQSGLDFLLSAQAADGSFVNSSGDGANANTTAVAAQAFGAAGRTAPAALANTFIRSLQWGCDVADADRGGIAFTTQASTIKELNVALAVRATPQALLGLTGVGLASVTNAGQAAGTTAMDCTVVVPEEPVTPGTPNTPSTPTDTPVTSPTTTTTAGTSATTATTTATTATTRPAGVLANTGSEVTVPGLLLGSGLLCLGLALLALRRRARA